ncbi:MAG: hypothetical protein ACIARQ_06165 [Phycisphaerales bacterium JB061]
MARTHRRKDVFAAVLIIGAALVYWMNRRTPDHAFDDRDTPAASEPRRSAPEVSDLPGLRRTE